jgi:hypothetical protein
MKNKEQKEGEDRFMEDLILDSIIIWRATFARLLPFHPNYLLLTAGTLLAVLLVSAPFVL